MRAPVSVVLLIGATGLLSACSGSGPDGAPSEESVAESAALQASTIAEHVSFNVSNPADGTPYTISGTLYRPRGDCNASVMILLHGLSGGAFIWDFPASPVIYSTARTLAAAGYASLAIDRLGYGDSTHPNGFTISMDLQASITGQIHQQLTAAPYSFQHVGLMGHSAGGYIAELAAGSYGGADVVIDEAYVTTVTSAFLGDIFANEIPAASASDYFYFGVTPAQRAAFVYYTPNIDPRIAAAETAHANLTPSGEFFSVLDSTPRFAAMANITAPVLMVLAENDGIFDQTGATFDLSLFASTDKTLYLAPETGHMVQVHRSAPDTNHFIVSWLREHGTQFPKCDHH